MEYEDKSVADLKRLCQKAGLPTVGKKSTLIRRLEDANHGDQTSMDRTLMDRITVLEKTILQLSVQNGGGREWLTEEPVAASSPQLPYSWKDRCMSIDTVRQILKHDEQVSNIHVY